MATSEDLTLASGPPPSSRVAAIPVGRVPEFDSSTRSWSLWFGRMQFFFVAYNIDMPEKKSHLLTLCGEQTCKAVS